MPKYPVAFRVGDPDEDLIDFSKDDVDKWKEQVAWWVKETQPSVADPKEKAEKIIEAALAGTKMNGEVWPGIEGYGMKARVRMLSGGWDVDKGRGPAGALGKSKRASHTATQKAKVTREANELTMNDLSTAEMLARREEFKELLIQQFPHLDNPVYESKINALAEAEIKLASLSEHFLTATPKGLEPLLKVKEGLRKDISELMDLLSIHPKQLKEKVDQVDRGDVASLIAHWEKLGPLALEYEVTDQIQELIQSIRSAMQTRVDGSPQLADWELWHKTGCRGHNYTCSCGRTVELFDGFTLNELIAAAEQAYKKYGFGLKKKEVLSGHGKAVAPSGVQVQGDGGREAVPSEVRPASSETAT